MIHNASVAIVGPAPYLSTARIEAVVAAVDTVARPNVRVSDSTMPGRLVLPASTTNRTDIVYHSGSLEGSETPSWSALTKRSAAAYADAGVRSLCLAVSADVLRKTRTGMRRNAAFRGVFNASLRADPTRARMELRHLVEQAQVYGCAVRNEFRTGIKMMVDVLLQRPQRLYIFGFDFYLSSTAGRAHGFEGYYRDVPDPELARWHNTSNEIRFFACLLEGGEAPLFLDPHLAGVLRSREPAAVAKLRPVFHASGIRLLTAWKGV